MIKQKFTFTTDQPVLDQLLDKWGLNYSEFATRIGITYKQLWKYRNGEHEFKLTTTQIKVIDQLLEPLELRWQDLPDDWMLKKVTYQ